MVQCWWHQTDPQTVTDSQPDRRTVTQILRLARQRVAPLGLWTRKRNAAMHQFHMWMFTLVGLSAKLLGIKKCHHWICNESRLFHMQWQCVFFCYVLIRSMINQQQHLNSNFNIWFWFDLVMWQTQTVTSCHIKDPIKCKQLQTNRL